MSYDPTKHTGGLRRLDSQFYSGRSVVHWTLMLGSRSTGWLDPLHHARFRENLCHALSDYGLVCPVYCLMPDHAHFLLLGVSPVSDQFGAVRAVRAGWNRILAEGGRRLQRQAFDHVLRENERERGALANVAGYILENPVRAGLANLWKDYPYLGALIPGYPEIDPRAEDFWLRFWRVYNYRVERSG